MRRAAELETPQTAADIHAVLAANPDPAALERLSENVSYNAQLRTTCVATMLEGGHASTRCRRPPGPWSIAA